MEIDDFTDGAVPPVNATNCVQVRGQRKAGGAIVVTAGEIRIGNCGDGDRPVMQAPVLRHATPVLWDSKTYQLDSDAFLSDAARYGLRSGIALPVSSATAESAMFSVCSPSLTLPDGQDLRLAIGRTYIFASYFHERFIHQLREQGRAVNTGSPKVTRREREVLELAAHGQSSKRIAYQLGISESTAGC